MADDIVSYLVEKYTRNPQQIETWRAAVFAAHIAHTTEPTTIIGIGTNGETMNMQVSASPEDRVRFLAQCKQALALINGTALPGGSGIKLDFSARCAST